jgi:hypothetical protein
MRVFPAIHLPDHFTRLLCINMQSTDQNIKNLPGYFEDNPTMNALAAKAFVDIDEKGNIKNIVKFIGWHGMRDRLAALYLYYKLHGYFPNMRSGELPIKFYHELIEFEQKFMKFTVEGYSRSYLLAFYLKMAHIEDKKSGDELPLFDLFDEEMIEYLALAKAKSIKVDYLLLQLFHFSQFLGKENLIKHLKNGDRYEEIYALMSAQQQQVYIKNFLAYGFSINEDSSFHSKLI